ncbi:hypothetical protein BC940DRAFT_25691 [Gongronella butleri]|nr:hypothetical protein BC940DRAFT_25691 [Gongronella butleri]
MPLRNVTTQLKTRWQRRASTQAQKPSLPTPPSTENDPPPTSQQQQQQQTTDTSNKPSNDKKKQQKEVPPNPDSQLNGIGDYVFERPLGHGKFSRVMLARHYLTGEQYAVKVKKKKKKKRERERQKQKCHFGGNWDGAIGRARAAVMGSNRLPGICQQGESTRKRRPIQTEGKRKKKKRGKGMWWDKSEEKREAKKKRFRGKKATNDVVWPCFGPE